MSRIRGMMCVAVAFVALTATGCMGTQRLEVRNQLNKDRIKHGLPMLQLQADANAKAQAWAEKLAREKKLYHSNLASGIKVRWCSLGENVGRGPDIKTIERAYMASPKHKANIVSTKWKGVGVGYATNSKEVFTVQVFIKTC